MQNREKRVEVLYSIDVHSLTFIPPNASCSYVEQVHLPHPPSWLPRSRGGKRICACRGDDRAFTGHPYRPTSEVSRDACPEVRTTPCNHTIPQES